MPGLRIVLRWHSTIVVALDYPLPTVVGPTGRLLFPPRLAPLGFATVSQSYISRFVGHSAGRNSFLLPSHHRAEETA